MNLMTRIFEGLHGDFAENFCIAVWLEITYKRVFDYEELDSEHEITSKMSIVKMWVLSSILPKRSQLQPLGFKLLFQKV